jgi:hypothetical protein
MQEKLRTCEHCRMHGESIIAQKQKTLRAVTIWVTNGRVPNTENPRKFEDLEGCLTTVLSGFLVAGVGFEPTTFRL